MLKFMRGPAAAREGFVLENWMSLFYVRPVAPHVVVNALFLYSFLGWMIECVVIRLERGVWENRGFVHLRCVSSTDSGHSRLCAAAAVLGQSRRFVRRGRV